MNTVPLTAQVLNRLTTASDDRVMKALDALHSGSMTISYRQTGTTIRATVRSIKWVGKKQPRCEEHHYAVQIHERGFDCSCPAFGFSRDHEACAHVLATVMAMQQHAQEMQQAA